jgi:DNA-binding CsgD family transcriptional regulator
VNLHLIIANWDCMSQWLNEAKIKSLTAKVPAMLFTFNDASSFARLKEIPQGVKIMDCIKKPINKIEFEAKLMLFSNLLDQFFNLKDQNSQIKNELDMKHRELSLHLELLMHSGSVKDKFVDGINTLQPYLNDEGRSKLRSMVKQFKWALNDEAFVSFETAFDDLHATLYRRLEKICPKITKNEKRLCAFVVKNHSASDIARIVGKSQNCINVAFARLRAKLKITNNKKLETFLSELQS